MADANWDNMLADFQESYQNASEFSDWMPPEAEGYTAVISSVKTGLLKPGQDGKRSPYWVVNAELVDGIDPGTGDSLAGRTFRLGFFSFGTPQKESIFKSFVTKLNGSTVGDLTVASRIIEDSIGRPLMVDIKTKGEYTNARVTEVLPFEAPAETSDEAPNEVSSEPATE